ncbi:hypothetical protein ASG03_14140 [Rhizobium sp. Leaf341]|nr:hypothetical protein ASG03_14140 [Rhizobium sp. Leaf341]
MQLVTVHAFIMITARTGIKRAPWTNLLKPTTPMLIFESARASSILTKASEQLYFFYEHLVRETLNVAVENY